LEYTIGIAIDRTHTEEVLIENEKRYRDMFNINHAVQPIDLGSIQLHIDISGVEVFTDPLMEKVFYNLVDNAKRYGDMISRIRFYGLEGEGRIYHRL
jgi:K+-sensing histidine kinase KdpD